MFYLAYNILSVFLLLPVIAYHLYRSITRGRPPAFRERFGYISSNELAAIRNRPVIWLHAVSVGESIAARPLLKALRIKYPGHAILVSNTTETGRGITSTFPEKDLCIYFPFDFLPPVCHVLKCIRPELIVIMETEIWPNFMRAATSRNIPVILANGRISDRSFSRYLQFSWFFKKPLQLFSSLCMQTETDSERIIAIGAPTERTKVIGNLKYDIPICQASADETKRLRDDYAVPENSIVITAGSTHAGEEQQIIDMYKQLTTTNSNLFMILVPRHPERSGEVAALLECSGIAFRRRTSISSAERFRHGEVLLVDTIGEMMNLYALSDVAFVGGSLVQTGGHNLLEPASAGVASVFGPFMTNFREIAELVMQYGAGVQVGSAEELIVSMQKLTSNIELRHVLGQNGLKMMHDNGGATERHLEIIARYL